MRQVKADEKNKAPPNAEFGGKKPKSIVPCHVLIDCPLLKKFTVGQDLRPRLVAEELEFRV
jgi:hypothetical protein